MTLTPQIDTLGLGAPYLGPWFATPGFGDGTALPTLGAPSRMTGDQIGDGDLSVDLNIAATDPVDLLPPAAGMLSLHVSRAIRPPALARLRRPDGSPAFDDDRLVLLYTLLPETEERLYRTLDQTLLHPVDGVAPVGASRPQRLRVRHLALQLTSRRVAELANLRPAFGANDSAADCAAAVGLELEPDDTSLLVNGQRPLANFHRPGRLQWLTDYDRLLHIPVSPAPLLDADGNNTGNTAAIRLMAFDDRGIAIDPGAVAAWWAAAAAQHNDLWAPGTGADADPLGLGIPANHAPNNKTDNDQRTCAVAAARTAHLVDPHDGPVDAALAFRIGSVIGIGSAALQTWPLWDADSAAIALSAAAAAAPPLDAATPDPVPVPHFGVLPSGVHAATLNLWGNPPAGGGANAVLPARDFVRVSAVEIESHLIGQRRVPPLGAVPADEPAKSRHLGEIFRADDQHRPTTRVRIAQSARPALIDSIEAATTAATTLIAAATAASVVAGSMDPDWGPLTPLPALPVNTALPNRLPQAACAALAGGDPASAGTAGRRIGQRVLLSLTGLPPGLWVRAWPSAFVLATGRYRALSGGAGLVDAAGVARMVVELPEVQTGDQVGIRFALHRPGAQPLDRSYGEQLITVPAPIGTGWQAMPFTAAAAATLALCEQGHAPPAALPLLRSGVTAVDIAANPPRWIDNASIPAAFWIATVANAFTGTDRLHLTAPVFDSLPDGRLMPTSPSVPNIVTRTTRTSFDVLSDNQPRESQQRLDQGVVDRAAFQAVLWTAPALASVHDAGPAGEGHPGSPAARETGGTGVQLSGAAADLVDEALRPILLANSTAMVNDAVNAAGNPAPAAGAGDTVWAAVLRTVAAQSEGEVAFPIALASPARFGDVVRGRDGTPPSGITYGFEPLDGSNSRPWAGTANAVKDWYDGRMVGAIDPPLIGSTDLTGSRMPAGAGWNAAALSAAKRAMDRRARAAGWGLREAIPALEAAFGRAQDFVYLETPALDLIELDPDGERRKLLQVLFDRLAANRHLRVIACVSAALQPGWPKGMARVWRDNLVRAIRALKAAGGDRVTVFAPAAGMDRPLHLSATTVIVDDAWALTGNTHLSRRGLSFDSSLATAIWDAALVDGRPGDVVGFRRRLIARRLSLPPNAVPDDPAVLQQAIAEYVASRSDRLYRQTLPEPLLDPDQDAARLAQENSGANPDGHDGGAGFDLLGFIDALFTNNQAITDEDDTHSG